MARLRVVLFGSSSVYASGAARELARFHELVALVRPARPGVRAVLRGLAGMAPPRTLEACARDLQVPLIDAASMDAEFRGRVAAMRPDLLCLALFPRRVPAEVTALAPLGCINAHPSLLPRHRGPLPLFWAYHADDRCTGVTIHHAIQRLDAGDIVLQEGVEIDRGRPSASVDAELARIAAPLLREAADALAAGSAGRRPQDEAAATYAPVIEPGAAMVRFHEWGVERVWHFLAGLCPTFREPLRDAAGRAVTYERVIGFHEGGQACAPGTVERRGSAILLYCRGGHVELA